MTALLEKAIVGIKQLPDDEQDEIARELLEMLASEQRWDALFADPRSEALMDKMAAKVRADIAAGRVSDGDPSDKSGP